MTTVDPSPGLGHGVNGLVGAFQRIGGGHEHAPDDDGRAARSPADQRAGELISHDLDVANIVGDHFVASKRLDEFFFVNQIDHSKSPQASAQPSPIGEAYGSPELSSRHSWRWYVGRMTPLRLSRKSQRYNSAPYNSGVDKRSIFGTPGNSAEFQSVASHQAQSFKNNLPKFRPLDTERVYRAHARQIAFALNCFIWLYVLHLCGVWG